MSRDYAQLNTRKRDAVFSLLRDLNWHEHTELARVGGVRYSARVLELKRLGYEIDSESVSDQGKRYRLRSVSPGIPQEKRVKVFLSEGDVVCLLSGQFTTAARQAVDDAYQSFLSNRNKL